MDASAALAAIGSKVSAYLPAAIGTVGALLVNPPETGRGMFGLVAFSFGCGIYAYGLIEHYLPWLGVQGSMMATAALGFAVLQMIGAGLKKVDLSKIATSWFSKKK